MKDLLLHSLFVIGSLSAEIYSGNIVGPVPAKPVRFLQSQYSRFPSFRSQPIPTAPSRAFLNTVDNVGNRVGGAVHSLAHGLQTLPTSDFVKQSYAPNARSFFDGRPTQFVKDTARTVTETPANILNAAATHFIRKSRNSEGDSNVEDQKHMNNRDDVDYHSFIRDSRVYKNSLEQKEDLFTTADLVKQFLPVFEKKVAPPTIAEVENEEEEESIVEMFKAATAAVEEQEAEDEEYALEVEDESYAENEESLSS